MRRSIFVVGGFSDEPDATIFESQLQELLGSTHSCKWFAALRTRGFRLSSQDLGTLRHEFTRLRSAGENPLILQINILNKESKRELTRLVESFLVPKEITSSMLFLEWLRDQQTLLTGVRTWSGSVGEAALVALLCKLVKNKSWNKDCQGHQWTKDADLLGQAPVLNPSVPDQRKSAQRLLERLEGRLFLKKGGSQGKTPLEWAIRLEFAPTVKRVLIEQNIGLLDCVEGFSSIREDIAASSTPTVPITFVNDRILAICQAPRST